MALEPEQRPRGPRQAPLPHALRLQRELPPAAVARRGRQAASESLLARMPGDDWQKRANLRLLSATCSPCPARSCCSWATSSASGRNGTTTTSLDWHLLHDPRHHGLQRWVRDLNTQYRAEPALHELDCRPDGFAWIDADNAEQGVLSFLRKGSVEGDLVAGRLQLHARTCYRNYRVGVPRGGRWQEILNSDADDLRRQRPGQHGRPDHRPDRLARAAAVAQPDPAAPGDPRPQADPPMSWRTDPRCPARDAEASGSGSGPPTGGPSRSSSRGSEPGRAIPLEKHPDGTFDGPRARPRGRGPLPLPRRRPRPVPRPGLAVPARGRARAIGGRRPGRVRLDRRRLARGRVPPTWSSTSCTSARSRPRGPSRG